MAVRLRNNVSLAEIDFGVVLLDEKTGDYWDLNPSGALVLRTLLDGGAPGHAAQQLTEMYDVDADSARRDVDDLIGGLRSAGLIEQ
jgi:hypothetical protein